MFYDREVKGDAILASSLTNFMPLFGYEIDPNGNGVASRMSLVGHLLTTGEGITYGSCDRYGISIYSCEEVGAPRIVMPAFNYFLARGLYIVRDNCVSFGDQCNS